MTVKEWWWLERLNDILKRVTQYGFMLHFERRTRQIMKLTNDATKQIGGGGGLRQQSMTGISMKDLSFVFNIYLAGMLTSGIVFGGELLHHHKLKIKHR